jgi:hypothetical protein
MRLRSTLPLAIVALGTWATGVGCNCKGKQPDHQGSDATAVVRADGAAKTSASPALPTNTNTNAACVVAYVNWPGGPQPGDDLSKVPVPMILPSGASLTISVRKTGHEVTLKGPAIFRPCTTEEPDVVLVARCDVSTDRQSPIRPGSEVFVATPACVAIVGRASVRLDVGPDATGYAVDEGAAEITNLDTPKFAREKDNGVFKRYEGGGVLLTRCGVQTAGAASTERMLAKIASAGGDASPLPSASIGVLTAELMKHARERMLDCAFALAFALSCDAVAKEKGDAGLAKAWCQGGYGDAQAHIAKSLASQDLPPGTPPPPGGP